MMAERIYSYKALMFFIVLQPILDVLTMLTNNFLGFSLGLVFRGLFVIYALFYLLFVDKKNKKFNIFFVSAIVSYLVIYFCYNCGFDLSLFLFKLNVLFKFFYLPITMLFIYKLDKEDCDNCIVFNGLTISLLMFLAQIFGGVILSYESGKLGNSGWFFSANELSALCSLILPLIYSKYVVKNNRLMIPLFCCLACTMLLIGTKTGYLSIGLTLLSFLTMLLLTYISSKNKKLIAKILVTLFMLVCFVSITPLTYAYKNVNIYDSGDSVSEIMLNGREEIMDSNLKEIDAISNKKDQHKHNLGHSKTYVLANRIFGIKLYSKINYEFERDYHDIYFNFGILGSMLFLLIPGWILVNNFKNFKKIKNMQFILSKCGIITSLLLGLSIAYISGHTLIFPAVSIYIAIVYVELFKSKTERKRKVMFISSVGGHLTQLLELKPLFEEYEYLLVTEKTAVTIPMANKYNVRYLKYGSRKYIIKYIFISICNIIKSLSLFNSSVPDVIVTTGTHTAVPMCYIGWLFGKKVIYIESFAKRTSPTLSGRIIYPVATTFVVQWESMLEYYPKAKCWGSIY